MKLLSYGLVAVIVVSGAVVTAQGQARGRGQEQGQGREQGRGEGRSEGRGASRGENRGANVVFSPRDTTLIRTHYGTRFKNLPPGLQKKLARGGTLPPGWQKKMEAFPASLERGLVVLPSGQRRGIHDGHAVIYDPLTHAIVDIVSLF